MLIRILKNNHGQGVAVEYAILFFIVVAVIAGMTTYVKRALQGRIHDARQYMYNQVNATYATLYANRLLPNGYEPYYLDTRTDKDETSITTQADEPWAGHEGRYKSGISSVSSSSTFSNVASAIHAE